MAHITRDGIKLCPDCMIAAVNGDFTGLDYHYGDGCDRWGRKVQPSADERMAQIQAGLERLGPGLVADFDSDTGRGIDEFAAAPLGGCGCCGSHLAGEWHDFAILADGPAPELAATA